VLKTVRHWTLLWASLIQPYFRRSLLPSILSSSPRTTTGLFGFSYEYLEYMSNYFNSCYTSSPAHLILTDLIAIIIIIIVRRNVEIATPFIAEFSPYYCYCYSYGVVSHKASHTLWPLLIHCASPFIHPPELSGSNQQTHTHTVAKKEKHGEKCPRILPEFISFSLYGILTCRKILRHVTNGFTSLRRKEVLRIFIALKIHRSRPDLNPRNLGLMASTTIIRPLMATHPAVTSSLLD
jgi:hypothetical protein